ncbi:MAG: hypothetical protein ABEI77_08200 [Halorientalis sp.]
MSRYDLVLAFVPTVFLVSLLVGTLFSVETHTAITGAGILGVIALVDALFINPPRGTNRS